MYKILLTLATALVVSFSYGQPEKKLAEAFIQSVAANNFELLKPFLPDVVTAKKIVDKELSAMSPARQEELVKQKVSAIHTKWQKVVGNAEKNKIDFTQLHLQQVLLSPIQGNNFLLSLLVTYTYNGFEWDDLLFFVNKTGTSKYLIELPLNTNIFALNEERKGNNIKAIQQEKDRNDPALREHLKNSVESLRNLVAANNTSELYSRMAYTGEEDRSNRWKRAIDPSISEDVESARPLLKKLYQSFSDCKRIQYQDVKVEKESEGTWYVLFAQCNNKRTAYAFLKVGDQFVLGDIK